MLNLGHLIDGKDVQDNSRVQKIYNPATGEVSKTVALASRKTVEQAIASAERAYPAWRDTPIQKRAAVMFRLKALLEKNADKICASLTEEHGKVTDDAMGELQRGIENVDYACGVPELLKGEFNRNAGPGIDSWSDFQPLGVVAGITPFNFPAMVPLWMWPMAVACGNAFILKPSEKDPSAAYLVASLAQEAGLPPGILNVVNGDKEAVDTLLHDTRVKAISFVGSTPIAEYIYATGSAAGKRVQALGGAKNHAVVMPDADLEMVSNAVMGAAYGSCGERCMAISVVVAVGDSVADSLIEKLTPALHDLRVGAGTDKNMDMGPLITAEHKGKVVGYIESGVSEGATLVVDGREKSITGSNNGFFLGASLFDNVTSNMTIYQEEIFGPVLCIVRVNSFEEALNLVNEHEYGNGTCIFTRDGEAARQFSDKVEVGMVGINVPIPVPVAFHSFGGWKRSLFGDLHAYGPDAVRFYTKRKTITQKWPSSGNLEGPSFSFPS
ncbi:MAG: CoA-acylating methylmalonate-semialdehyde dehydrogenase [Arenicella sp.]|nr:CoA-acylating methylmalonate-semialdehyde dehydrogenase [Arenicella sp.]